MDEEGAMDTRILSTVDAVLAAIGREIGVSEWLLIEQSRVDAFAAVVGDFQWIHCDPARAAKESAFGGTIAHGALTLSLVSTLREDLRGTRIELNAKMGVLYGYNKVRFVSPVPVGSRIRLRQTLADAKLVKPGVFEMQFKETVEVEGKERPALIVEAINRKFLD
ncbi:nodulation protein NodN [Shinella yambaruensis]|uniref:Nodulation protein NodN n=2 Tax=Shinella yambaruensis TaxID=415996 RepID=A0ABQ5ZR10_9HYPH|nr:nodulation protein NodN [Shinella yambaruensis]